MKGFILVDKENIVRCMATEKVNLHEDKLHLDLFEDVELKGSVGDEYEAQANRWVKRPENYPQPSNAEKREELIQGRMRTILRKQAMDELITEGVISEA